MKRYRFVKDDDGHNYLIDATKVAAFDEWVAYMNDSLFDEDYDGEDFEADYDGEDFEADRIAGPIDAITFTDPKED